jgi:penicillin-binding protein 1A
MGLFRRSRGREAHRTGGPPAPDPPFFKRLPWEIRFVILAPIYIGLPACLVLAAVFVYYTTLIPNPMALRHKERIPVIRILARDGSVLAERGSADEYVPIDLLPQHLIDAVIATEDRRFFEHRGLDPASLLRALFANLRAGRFVQGGSTLTQQLAKNLFLSSERTISRKLEESVLALWLEFRLNKRDILELYLNRVYFGGGAFGVEAAARRYFNKSAQAATLSEAAVLAGLLKAPSKFSPTWNPVIAWTRARAVLSKMVEAGLLSAQEADRASRGAVRFSDAAQRGDRGLDYAVDAVLDQLPHLVGPLTNDLIVETTIDPNLQRQAQRIVHDAMMGEGRSVEASQAGLVLLDMDGGMRAVVGGRSYAESQFNRALKARRQPGSAFKPFVYLAAVESGLTPDSIVQDLPILGSGWSPRNEGAGYRGAVTLRQALAYSMNAAAARLHMRLGARKTASVARRLGIKSQLHEDASLALGTSEVTLLELAGAYGVFANDGKALEPHVVTRVRTGAGRLFYQRPHAQPRMLVAPAHVAALNDMLSAVLVSGTGQRAALARHPAAGKTGTSQDFRDAWFIGYTTHFVAGVWVGNDDGHAMNKVVGGSLPARLWHDVMTIAHEGLTPSALPGAAPKSAGLASTNRAVFEGEGDGPRLPRERIKEDFVARALASDHRTDAAQTPWTESRRTWLDTALSEVKRGLGFAP